MKYFINRTKGMVISILLLCISLVILGFCFYGVKNIISTVTYKKTPIYRVETQDKKIAISFDIAWGDKNIEEILKTLDYYDTKSTFFLVGTWVDNNKSLVKQIDKKGHEIGNHSTTHAKMTKLSEEDIINEIEATSDKIEGIIGKRPIVYRPPFGEYDNKSIEVCEKLGYKVIKWDIDSLDWKEIGPNHVIDTVVKNSKPGSIILFHGGVEYTKDYLPKIIKTLQKEGYDIVPVSELLYKQSYTIDKDGTQKIIK